MAPAAAGTTRANREPTIGQRITGRRKLLGLSVRGAALAANLSHSAWSRIERGERSANNRFVLARIARVLRCSVSDLTGDRTAPDAREAASTSAAVTDAFRAIMTADPEYSSRMTDAPLLRALEERVATIRRLRLECNYVTALRMLPETVYGLHARLSGPDEREALRLLILLEEAASSIVRYQGTASATALITERMRDTARRLEDPLMIALAALHRSLVSSRCGAYDYARVVADGAAQDLSTHAGKRGAPELLGMLMLTTAFACYGDGAASDAVAYLEEAKRLATRTGDTMTLSLFFGPTNIRMWEISMEGDGGDPGRAIRLARLIDPTKVPHLQRQVTFYVDTGRAYAHLGRDDDALSSLIQAERLAPAHVQADPLIWETVRDIVDRRQRKAVPDEVRVLCGRLGVAL